MVFQVRAAFPGVELVRGVEQRRLKLGAVHSQRVVFVATRLQKRVNQGGDEGDVGRVPRAVPLDLCAKGGP